MINNPNNPTGSLMDRAFLEQVATICDRAGAWLLLCDEVYRGIDQADPGTTVSVADIYDRGLHRAGRRRRHPRPQPRPDPGQPRRPLRVDRRQPRISWIKPCSGTTALLKHELPQTSRDLCVQLLEETGVMLTPGSAMAMEGYMEGYLRIGYAPNPGVLAAGLPLLSDYLHSH